MCIHVYDPCPCTYDPIIESRNNTAYFVHYNFHSTKYEHFCISY